MGYSASDVTRITGVKRTRLQQWLERSFIVPSIQEASGPGTRNIYNRMDIYNIALFKKITESGWPRKMAADFICAGAFYSDAISKEYMDKVTFMVYVRRGDSVKAVAVDADDGVIDLAHVVVELDMSSPDDIYIINFHKLKRDIDEKIDALGWG